MNIRAPGGREWGGVRGNSKGRRGTQQGPVTWAEGPGEEQVIPGEQQSRAVTLKKASSKTSSGPEKPTTSSGWAPSREKRIPSTAVDTISSDTPISPSVFSPGEVKGQWTALSGSSLAPLPYLA